MNMAGDIDQKRLASLRRSSDDARGILEHLAARPARTSETEVDEVERKGFARLEIVRVMKALSQLGVGKFIVGRKQHASRFQWARRPADLAAALSPSPSATPSDEEDLDDFEVDDDTGDEDEADADTVERASQRTNRSFVYEVPLRKDFIVRIELPSYITPREAERLADFVKTLAVADD